MKLTSDELRILACQLTTKDFKDFCAEPDLEKAVSKFGHLICLGGVQNAQDLRKRLRAMIKRDA
jgi:hypothetical protein